MEIQGFKTFAKKTVLDLPRSQGDGHALTVIIGPNGSGKSNIADAIRWCLGEQSMKLLRGKKSEDMIFSGSEGKTRSGAAEVTLLFDNHDHALSVDYDEVELNRRQYRDGSSEYRLNGKITRLQDIQLLLAEAGIGERSYTVIAQGMIDHVLIASPEERKLFFDDATGVRGLQMKRHQSLLRLEKSSEHLLEIERLLAEAEPRLRLLERQVKRLEKREVIENELQLLSKKYYGTQFFDLSEELRGIDSRLQVAKTHTNAKTAELQAGDQKLLEMERLERARQTPDHGLQPLQDEYRKASEALRTAEHAVFEAQRNLEVATLKSQTPRPPLPMHEVVQIISSLKIEHQEILSSLKSCHVFEEVQPLFERLETFNNQIKNLHERLTRPAIEQKPIDPALQNTVAKTKADADIARANLKTAEEKLTTAQKAVTSHEPTELFAFQRDLRKLQSDLYLLEQESNRIELEKARVETRLEGLRREIQEQNPTIFDEIKNQVPTERDTTPEETRGKLMQLRHQLELIGSIDEETIAEYKETNERVTFLQTQFHDLHEAIEQTEKVVDELEDRIAKQSEEAFAQINIEFQKYFAILFGGGSCKLLKTSEVQNDDAMHVAIDRAFEVGAEALEEQDTEIASKIIRRFKNRHTEIAGIEILATPPGKRLKSLNLLSGGERALTSLALLCAIMATHPSPFVVLDEVDAALDEANTVRFANILEELRKFSQFIIITHNRATMERADKLFGVSMGEDGISNLLSVSLSDIGDGATARR
jgi:chromosome segregation protein